VWAVGAACRDRKQESSTSSSLFNGLHLIQMGRGGSIALISNKIPQQAIIKDDNTLNSASLSMAQLDFKAMTHGLGGGGGFMLTQAHYDAGVYTVKNTKSPALFTIPLTHREKYLFYFGRNVVNRYFICKFISTKYFLQCPL
jgi:hypothetical protein